MIYDDDVWCGNIDNDIMMTIFDVDDDDDDANVLMMMVLMMIDDNDVLKMMMVSTFIVEVVGMVVGAPMSATSLWWALDTIFNL